MKIILNQVEVAEDLYDGIDQGLLGVVAQKKFLKA
jgi:hypothetical protein